MTTKSDARIVKKIIEQYGHTLDLRASPYVILEIIRQYGDKLGGPAADCAPPGGPPPKQFDPFQLVRELRSRLADVDRLSTMLEETVKPKPRKRAAKHR